MKLYQEPVLIERSTDFQSNQFSIGDLAIVFDILRNKLYSNPVGSIVREISSNARDAHREVGKFDLPIEIHLPSRLEPTFEVKDYGPGISPDRMENVFVKYASSTKREDNVQQGAFGLGAKVPFSYTTSFNIITCVNGIKYTYVAYIDETRVGKVDLLSQVSTDELNGTQIVVPVKPTDFNYFKDEVMKNLYFWKIKPILRGISPTPEFNTNKNLECLISGQDWEIWRTGSNYTHNYLDAHYDTSSAIVLVDDVPYKISAHDLGLSREGSDYAYRMLLERRLRLYFNIGELTLSANRENIHYDDKTQKLIRDRLKSIVDNIVTDMQASIDACTCLSDAEITLSDLNNTFLNIAKPAKPFSWKGINLKGTLINNVPNLQDAKIVRFYVKKSRRSIKKSISSDQTNQLLINRKYPIYIHDLDIEHMPVARINHFLNENPEIEGVQVIKHLNKNVDVFGIWDTAFNFKSLTFNYISSMEEPVKVKKPRNKSNVVKAEAYLFAADSYKKSEYWMPYSLTDALDKAKGDKVIYVNLEDKRTGTFSTDLISPSCFRFDTLNHASKILDREIIGIKTKELAKLDKNNFISLGDYLHRKYIELANKHDLSSIYSLKEANEFKFSTLYGYTFNRLMLGKIKNIKDQSKDFARYLTLSDKIESEEQSAEVDFLIYLHEIVFKSELSVVKKDHELKTLQQSCLNRYPLINLIASSSYTLRDVDINNIVNYINMIDAIN